MFNVWNIPRIFPWFFSPLFAYRRLILSYIWGDYVTTSESTLAERLFCHHSPLEIFGDFSLSCTLLLPTGCQQMYTTGKARATLKKAVVSTVHTGGVGIE